MFEADSRYAGLAVAARLGAGGRPIVYAVRRILPALPERAVVEVVVGSDDRLDLMAYRTLGDPGQWWRIADANAVLDPRELEAEPGARVRLALPGV